MTRYPRISASAGIAKRKAFQKPPRSYLRRIAELKQHITDANSQEIITTTPAEPHTNLYPSNQDLHREIFNMITNPQNAGMHYLVPQIYIQLICEHINTLHSRNLPGQIPVCTTLYANFFRHFYEGELEGKSNNPLYSVLKQLVSISSSSQTPANFLLIRHFLLLDRTRSGHIALIVISPIARTVDILDSHVRWDEMRQAEDYKVGVVFRMLAGHLGDLFQPDEWRFRQGYSPYQGTTRDCAVYTMTNAMFVALGYPLEYHHADMRNRRYAIAAELLNSADGGMLFDAAPSVQIPELQRPFAYTMTEYWAGPGANDLGRGFVPLSNNKSVMSFLPLVKTSLRRNTKGKRDIRDIILKTGRLRVRSIGDLDHVPRRVSR